MSKPRGHSFKMKGTKYKDIQGKFFYPESGGYLYHVAMGDSGGRYDRGI